MVGCGTSSAAGPKYLEVSCLSNGKEAGGGWEGRFNCRVFALGAVLAVFMLQPVARQQLCLQV